MTRGRSGPFLGLLPVLTTPFSRPSGEASWTLVAFGAAWIVLVALLHDPWPGLWLPGFVLKTIGLWGILGSGSTDDGDGSGAD